MRFVEERFEGEKYLSQIAWVQLVITGKGRNQSTERGSVTSVHVHDEGPRIKPWENQKRKYERTRGCYHI